MIVARYEKPIFNLACRMVRDADDAADITQSTFVKAYRKLETFNQSHKFFSWLYRIAVNESLNHLGRKVRAEDYQDDHPSALPEPDDDLLRSEAEAFLTRALAVMPFEQRIVIILKHLILLSYHEIAEILDIPEKTVKSRLYTARQVLRDQLTKQGYTR